MNICGPTGNFGNILAAAYAKRMGLPVGKLICASNQNHVLTDFIRTGVYDRRREFLISSSPSMDILISSNLERMLFEIVGRNDETVRTYMRALKAEGIYTLAPDELAALQEEFYGGWTDEPAVRATIEKTYRTTGHVIDPHTAVAVGVLESYRNETGDNRPCVVAATASPYKFGRAVYDALGGDVSSLDDFACCDAVAALANEKVPAAISALPTKPVLHTQVCTPEEMVDVVLG